MQKKVKEEKIYLPLRKTKKNTEHHHKQLYLKHMGAVCLRKSTVSDFTGSDACEHKQDRERQVLTYHR